MVKQDFKVLDDREHILHKPGMYAGSMSEEEREFFLHEDGKMVYHKLTYIPAFLKIVNEILDNSIDEAIRNKFELGNKISVEIFDKRIIVTDNGAGLPIEKEKKTGLLIPIVAFTRAKSGCNFTDDRETIGTNGVGSFLTNVFSNKFIVETCDGKKFFKMVCENNALEYNHIVDTAKSDKTYTKVEFEPDLKRFNMSRITDVYSRLIEQRIFDLTLMYPKIKFSFNNKSVKFEGYDKFLQMFTDKTVVFEQKKNYLICAYPSPDKYKMYSVVNGLGVLGGTHEKFVLGNITDRMKILFSKKYPQLKTTDITNNIGIIIILTNFRDMQFDSQTKERLTNSVKSLSEHIKINWDTFVKKIVDNKDISSVIDDIYISRQDYEKKKLLNQMNNHKGKRVKVDGYLPAIKRNKYFVLSEGDSACGLIASVLGRQEYGYYPLKGVPLSVYETSIDKINNNQEMSDIHKILRLQYKGNNANSEYDKIVLATDADADGQHIIGLLLTYFYEMTLDLVKNKRIAFLRTPIIVGRKKDKIENWFFSIEEFNNYQAKEKSSGIKFEYMKGLGSYTPAVLRNIIAGKIEDFLEYLEIDDTTSKMIDDWMSDKKADRRKEMISEGSFDINKV